jgi:cytochrome c556
MKRIIVLLTTISFAVLCSALAQDNPIKERQAIMKKNGEATKLVSGMLKGETPYDAAAAAEAMNGISGVMDKFVTLFPEGSAEGSDAKPEIWQDKADFDAKAQTVKEAAAKAAEAAPGGKDSFQAAFGNVGQGCKGCHEKYRVPPKK